MSTDDKMTIDEQRNYLRRMKTRYVEASHSKLLDEMMHITELDRKTLIRLMARGLNRKPRQRQRSRSYGSEADDALRIIVKAFDYVCAKQMTPQLVIVTQQLARHGELHLTSSLLTQLGYPVAKRTRS